MATNTFLRSKILASTPSIYLPLDATYGITDQSGNGRNGTAQGGITIGGGPSLTGDPYDSSTQFALSGYKHVTTSYNPFTAGSTRTFICCVQRTSDAQNDPIWGSSGLTTNWSVLYQNFQSHSFTFITNNTTGGYAYSSVWSTPFNRPYFIAIVYDDTNHIWKSYINNYRAPKYNNPTVGYYSNPGNIAVGAQYNASGVTFCFDGNISHFAVFERELSAGEIFTIADAAIVRTQGRYIKNRIVTSLSPSFYYPLNHTYGPKDYSGNGRDALDDPNSNYQGVDMTGDTSTPTESHITSDINEHSSFYSNMGAILTPYNPFSSAARTFACVIKRKTNTTVDTIFSGSGANPPSLFMGEATNQMIWDTDSTSGNWYDGPTWNNISVDVAHSIVLLWNEGTNAIDLYVDGTSLGATTWTENYGASPGNLQIGARGSTCADGFFGHIGHFAVWERTLNTTEIAIYDHAVRKAPAGRIIEAGG